jgi:REP element-mobilizing transposase RayT
MLIFMPRRPRYEASGALHHVVSRGNAGEAIVRNDIDRGRFLDLLDEAIARYRWRCLAYCLLDTHFHVVLRTPEPNLGDGMQWLKSRYAEDLNFRHGRTGHVFGGRFYSAPLESDSHLITALLYVFLNPVRAGLGRSPADWTWSSYPATIGEHAPRFLDVASVLELFGAEPSLARARLRSIVDETVRLDRERRVGFVRGQTPGV